MKHLSLKRGISFLLVLMLCASCLSLFATTAVAEAKIIDLPIIINGGYFAGQTGPYPLNNLPVIEGVEYCDADCDCGNAAHYRSNLWYNQSDASVATEFVDGEYYVYVITIHPAYGYAFPSGLTTTSDLINVTNVDWYNSSNAIVESDCISVAFRYKYQSSDGCIVGDKNVSAPIVIDGSDLRGITAPTSLWLADKTGVYTHCDGTPCGCSDAYLSDTWFDERGDVVTEFVDGNEYFYQVTIHFEGEYTLNPNILPEHAINVTGIAWDSVRADYDDDRLYAEFHIESYDSSEGIPARYEAEIPYIFDGRNLGGLNTPMGLGLEDTEEYYHCYDGCDDNYWYASDTWFTSGDKTATEFVDGEEYYYQISIHPQAGYYFDFSYLSDDELPIMVTGIKWDSISWYSHDDGVYACFYMTYDAETGVPFGETIEQIVIDGSSMAGATAPESINVPDAGTGYNFCGNDECCEFGTGYPGFTWFDSNDMPATEFVDGEDYYFQVVVHPEYGYEFDVPYYEVIENSDEIIVTGIDWNYIESWYSPAKRLFYTEFWITYNAETGIPESPKVKLPITIDGSALNGITAPKKLTGLPSDESYYYCNDACQNGWFKYNTWYDADDNEVTEFVDGEQYYFQIAIHAADGYEFVAKNSVDYKNTLINVTGVEWDKVRSYYRDDLGILYAEFWITYEAPNSGTDPNPEPQYKKGDVNMNGKIDARDYLLLKRAFFKTFTLKCDIEIADINDNGKIDARDYLLLKRAFFKTYTIK